MQNMLKRKKSMLLFRVKTRVVASTAFKQNDVEQGACKYRPDTITIDRIYK